MESITGRLLFPAKDLHLEHAAEVQKYPVQFFGKISFYRTGVVYSLSQKGKKTGLDWTFKLYYTT